MTIKKTIVFTGGGTSGHVTPNIALINALDKNVWRCAYMGSPRGIERALIKPLNIPYKAIQSGKLRRYFSWQNFIDPFKIVVGFFQALWYLFRLRPTLVFSKGGFVAVPVVLAAWVLRIPVIAHESDFSPGLANRLSFPFAKTICVSFAEAKKQYFNNADKVIHTGSPLRPELFKGDASVGRVYCGFNNNKPCILVIGGGLGAAPINTVVREALPELLKDYNIIHCCGQGKLDPNLDTPDYMQIEYANESLPDLFACAEFVVSRSGANSVYEILALAKPHVFIPLSKAKSRGDQIQNAKHFEQYGVSRVIDEERLDKDNLLAEIAVLSRNKTEIIKKLEQLPVPDAVTEILQLINTQR